jgi:putative intracellular protease/amidase
MANATRRIGVLVEAHFDETEARRFDEFFPQHGFEVEYLSHLWGHDQLEFTGNDHQASVTANVEVASTDPRRYDGIILIGGYAMDRLRYEERPEPGRPNQAPAVAFLRRAVSEMDQGRLKIGAICHGLWLFCADAKLLRGRYVTCAHNVIADVENAGGIPVFDGAQTASTYVHGGLVTGRHPGVLDDFLQVFLAEVNR